MNIILENYALPETGEATLTLNLTFEIKFTAHQAQRKVDTWLMNEVSIIMGANEPALVVRPDCLIWRVPAHLRSRELVVGTVDVDATTGQIIDPNGKIEEIEIYAQKMAALFEPTPIRKVPPEFIPKNIPRAPTYRIGEDGKLHLVDETKSD